MSSLTKAFYKAEAERLLEEWTKIRIERDELSRMLTAVKSDLKDVQQQNRSWRASHKALMVLIHGG